MFALLLPLIKAQSFIQYDISECIPIYGTDAFDSPGQVQVTLTPLKPNGSLALGIFPFLERNHLAFTPDPNFKDYLICNEDYIKQELCSESELGRFHIIRNSTAIQNDRIQWQMAGTLQSSSTIGAKIIVQESSNPRKMILKYPIQQTDFYCLYMSSNTLEDNQDYVVDFTIVNPYGFLPAIYYPALPFFAIMSGFYTFIGACWMYVSFRYWKDLLLIQHYVSLVIAFLIVEMAFNYSFFSDYNSNGKINYFLLVITVVLNAARNSISFFMLLIVSLGYGVVKPTLGEVMNSAVLLAVAHFVFGVLYGVGALITEDANSTLVLLSAIPLSMTMTSFYMWTMSGLSNTMNHLETRRQTIKLLMYKRLWYILMISIVAMFVIFALNSVNISYRNTEEWIVNQFKWRWFMVDGLLNILYFIVFSSISFLWMPTENNQRYGLEQLVEDDEFHVIHDEESPIKLRNLRESDGESTADEDILAWAEEEFKE
ncbi:hypothetical protein HDV06_006121 [Boothiomyces sp. JEL0866]|nr:hypothetical protein HDV06_006121 [Boothiomyces sp. JEL0866]